MENVIDRMGASRGGLAAIEVTYLRPEFQFSTPPREFTTEARECTEGTRPPPCFRGEPAEDLTTRVEPRYTFLTSATSLVSDAFASPNSMDVLGS
jgi:hypothetical protein